MPKSSRSGIVRPSGRAVAVVRAEDEARDRPLCEDGDHAGRQQGRVLRQGDRPDTEDLAGQQLERRGRVEDDLHHPR